MDAVFNLKSAIRKRKEHGMETWVLLLDLVKAFDRVPRELLWLVMERFGFPKLIIRLLKALHEKVLVNFEVEGVKKVIESIIGVKQGDLLGPILFNIYGCAVMVAWRTIRAGMHERGELQSCVFKTNQDFVLGTATAHNRRNWRKKGEEFSMDDSTYADDTAALFASREDCEVGVPKLIDLMARFGGEVHVRKPGQVKASKSVVVFIAKKASEYAKGDLTFGGTDVSDIDVGKGCTVGVVKQAKYLGCLIDRDCKDDSDVKARIQQASRAFGSIQSCIFSNSAISMRVKAAVYTAVVLSVLLYGCEAWALTCKLWTYLRSFHRRCVRRIAGVNMWHVMTHRLTSEELLDRTGIRSLEVYTYRRQLRWIGHVRRMPWDRLPRKFMSAWCGVPRPPSAPNYRWGDGAEKAIAAVGLGVAARGENAWHKAAADRGVWREVVAGYGEEKNKKRNSEGYWREIKKRRNQTTTRTQRQRARAGWGVSMGVKQYARAWDGVRDNAPLPAASFLTPGISLANSTSAQQAMYHAQAAIVARYEAAQQATTTTATAAAAPAAAAATPPAAAQPRRYGFFDLPPRAPQAGLQQQAAATGATIV